MGKFPWCSRVFPYYLRIPISSFHQLSTSLNGNHFHNATGNWWWYSSKYSLCAELAESSIVKCADLIRVSVSCWNVEVVEPRFFFPAEQLTCIPLNGRHPLKIWMIQLQHWSKPQIQVLWTGTGVGIWIVLVIYLMIPLKMMHHMSIFFDFFLLG